MLGCRQHRVFMPLISVFYRLAFLDIFVGIWRSHHLCHLSGNFAFRELPVCLPSESDSLSSLFLRIFVVWFSESRNRELFRDFYSNIPPGSSQNWRGFSQYDVTVSQSSICRFFCSIRSCCFPPGTSSWIPCIKQPTNRPNYIRAWGSSQVASRRCSKSSSESVH